MTDYKPGSRWKSAVCGAEFVVVRAPGQVGELACGGVAVRAHGDGAELVAPTVEASEPVMAGKRYTEEQSGIEVLASKPGKGALSFAGRALSRKEAKPLPASD